MIIDEPGLPGIPYVPPRPRPTAPKPKPKPKPVYRPPARPASRPPGVASPYRPKPRTTTPLRPANFSTITASARSRVGNIYAPGGLSFPTPQFTADPASRGAYGVQVPGTTGRRYTATGGYDPALFKPAPFGPWDKATTEALVRAGVYGAMPGDQPIPTAQRPDKGKAGTGGGRSGYVPRAYYGGGGGYSGGGGGGGGGLVDTAMALFRPLRTQCGKVAGQLDVLAYREEWQQVELLENVAGVVDAKTIARASRKLGQFLAEQADTAPAGFLHPAKQAQQCGFATAARALEKQGFSCFQAERRDVQQLWVIGPVEAQVRQFDQCVGHGKSVLPGGGK